ncbi:MAG: GNAT family N-acetyltransferase [Emcibacteraceae bacterium]
MKLRTATMEDCRDIFIWRNDLTTRQMSIDTGEINFENHVNWLEKTLKNNNLRLYILESENKKVGVVRFDRADQDLIVSINLNPAFRGQGLAVKTLSIAIDEIRKEWKFDTIIAKIKSENKASIALFEKCGFVQKECINNILIYTMK